MTFFRTTKQSMSRVLILTPYIDFVNPSCYVKLSNFRFLLTEMRLCDIINRNTKRKAQMNVFIEKIIDFFTLDTSDPMRFAGQLVGFIPLVIAFITFSLSKRKHILISKTISDLTSAIHFFLLGEIVGGAVCVVNTGRGVVFYNKGKRWASGIYIPIVFCALTLLTTLLQWKGWYTLLPAIGSVLAVIGFWCNRPRLVKLFNLPAVSLWLVYSVITQSIAATLINVISIITILVSMIRELVKYTKSKSNANINEDITKDGE